VGTLSLVIPLPPEIEQSAPALYLLEQNRIAHTWPCPYDIDLIGCCTIYCCHTGECRAEIDRDNDSVFLGILAEHGG
jgi:hypothetical protein